MTTHIADIFARDVSRHIEGVIKADDTADLDTEVQEYVLTGEIASALELMLETYTAPRFDGGNGVWISGFFGSGKSHLLKMLAHLLGEVPGQAYDRLGIIDAFKTKAEGNAILVALLTKCAATQATSLLFNIDQKAHLITKDQADALLRVFVKVFDESRGYCGNQPHIARFERDLDERGIYQQFKDAYAAVAGRPWSQGREQGILEEANVTKAYAQATGDTAGAPVKILTKYRDETRVSIEDFADEVADWLTKQGPEHRLLFLVDEVGQFIGTNTKLMLNLQTIVETLKTKCGGRAWVFVTSQEDMDQVIGDRNKSQANDFSKIQARFSTRMKLTSQDVKEVIEKRLLSKNPTGESVLASLYDDEHANLRTLFDFVDGAKTYRNYADEADFSGLYPFVPYQFPFFQAALVGLSEHNVFEGRHSSVGERSMLGVVQEVTGKLIDQPVGAVVPFDLMFAGIRQAVKSAAIRNITTAERQLPSGNDTALRLLRALFLVKYIEGFNATARNLAVLLYDHFGQDLTDLHFGVNQALELLEQQTYIQRNGTKYEYLTNEEQEIEQEIKNTDIDSAEVSRLLIDIIRGDVVKVSSFRHTPTGRDFKFGVQLDNAVYGTQHDLTVHYISAFGEYETGLLDRLNVIKAHSANRDELRVVLSDDGRLYQDLRLAVQTKKYVQRKRSTSLTQTQQRILDQRGQHVFDLEKELKGRVREAIKNASFIINGSEIAVPTGEPEARVQEGFNQLISRIYTQLATLSGVEYSETGIAAIVQEPAPALVEVTARDLLQDAADEVNTFILGQRRLGANVTVKRIVEQFEAKPYGWPLAAILSAVARLFAHSQVTLSLDSQTLKRTEVAEALRNGAKRPNTVVAEQRQFDPGKVQQVRHFTQEFFNEPNLPTDPMELAAILREKLASERRELQTIRHTASQYPFVTLLDAPLALLNQVIDKTVEWYLDEFIANVDDLLDAKQDAIDPIQAFLNGPQRAIYDDAARLLSANQANFGYLPDGEAGLMKALLEEPKTLRGTGMNRLKEAAAALKRATDEAVQAARRAAASEIEERWQTVQQSAAWSATTGAAQDQARAVVERATMAISSATSIPVIKQHAAEFDERGYTSILNIVEVGRQQAAPSDEQQPKPVIVSIKTLPKPRAGAVLTTDEDIESYVSELRAILRQAIGEGKRVSL
ncbi:MAG: BREX system P-loop protein BrxC [Propionibacteriaceae bacterium]|nr:BREX system P-loop protein BrxC [Propionibacteriaceae bacterium]